MTNYTDNDITRKLKRNGEIWRLIGRIPETHVETRFRSYCYKLTTATVNVGGETNILWCIDIGQQS